MHYYFGPSWRVRPEMERRAKDAAFEMIRRGHARRFGNLLRSIKSTPPYGATGARYRIWLDAPCERSGPDHSMGEATSARTSPFQTLGAETM